MTTTDRLLDFSRASLLVRQLRSGFEPYEYGYWKLGRVLVALAVARKKRPPVRRVALHRGRGRSGASLRSS